MGEEGGGFSPSALSLFRFHQTPFPQKRLILRLTSVKLHVLSDIKVIQHECKSTDTK